MRRTSLEGDPCPVARALDAIGDWWSLLIVRNATSGMSRFGEFQASLGIGKNILAIRLRALVEQGVLEHVAREDGEPARDYVLTEKGRSLFPVLVALRQWGEAHSTSAGSGDLLLVERSTGRPLRRMQVLSADGLPLKISDTTLVRVQSPAAAGAARGVTPTRSGASGRPKSAGSSKRSA